MVEFLLGVLFGAFLMIVPIPIKEPTAPTDVDGE